MSPEMADIAIPTFLKCIRQRLEQAAGIAKAAEAGNLEKGVEPGHPQRTNLMHACRYAGSHRCAATPQGVCRYPVEAARASGKHRPACGGSGQLRPPPRSSDGTAGWSCHHLGRAARPLRVKLGPSARSAECPSRR
jgi:hypothetical protein